MKTTHTNKEGNTKLIVTLGNNDLINIIKLHCREIYKLILLLNDNSFKGSKFFQATNPDFDIDNKRKINATIKKAHEDLSAYVIEATLRGLANYIIKDLQLAYGRGEAIKENSILLSLNENAFIASKKELNNEIIADEEEFDVSKNYSYVNDEFAKLKFKPSDYEGKDNYQA
jgi:hypothetical protein